LHVLLVGVIAVLPALVDLVEGLDHHRQPQSQPPLLLLLLSMLRLHAAGPEEAVQYVKQSGIKLCALGADGQVLRDAGLEVSCT
jgi:hypothetical protein